MDWLDIFAVQGTLKSLLQNHSSKASILQLSIHPYCTALGASGICTLLTRRLQTPHSLSVRPTAHQTANGFIFPLLDPGTGYVTGVTHSPGHISIYVISLSLESLPGTQVSTVPFLPTQFCIDHSYSLSCIVVFMLSFWIVFSENYSLCRCIFFYLFMGSGEVHVLLFHYLDLYPYI